MKAGDFRVVGMGAALSALKEGIATKEAMMRESAEDEKDADKCTTAFLHLAQATASTRAQPSNS